MESIDLDDDFYEDIDLDADHTVDEKEDKEEEEHNRWQIIHEQLINDEKNLPSGETTKENDNKQNENNGINENKNDQSIKLENLQQHPISTNINSPTKNSGLLSNHVEMSFTNLIEKMENDFSIKNKNQRKANKEVNNNNDMSEDKDGKKKFSFVSLPGRIQLEILSYCSEGELFNCLQTCFQISRAAAIILWGSQLSFGKNDKERLKQFVGALNRKPQIHPYATYVQNVSVENIMDEIPMYTRNPCWILVRELLYHCSKNIRRLKLGFQDEKFPEIKSLEIPDIYFSSLEELDIEPYSDVSPEFITDLLKRCEANGRLRKLTIPNCFWGFIPFSVLAEVARIGNSLVLLDLSAYKQSPKQEAESLPELTSDTQIKEFNDLMMMIANSCKNIQFLNISHNIYLYDTTVEQFLITNTKLERIYLEDTHVSDYTLLAFSHSSPPAINYIELKCGFIDNPDNENPYPPTTKFTTSVLEMVLKDLNNRKGLCDIIAISLPDRLIQPGSTSLISTKVWLNTLEGCTLDEDMNNSDPGWRKWRKYGKLRLWV